MKTVNAVSTAKGVFALKTIKKGHFVVPEGGIARWRATPQGNVIKHTHGYIAVKTIRKGRPCVLRRASIPLAFLGSDNHFNTQRVAFSSISQRVSDNPRFFGRPFNDGDDNDGMNRFLRNWRRLGNAGNGYDNGDDGGPPPQGAEAVRGGPPPPPPPPNRAAEEVMYNEELKEGVPGPPSIDDWWQWDSERRVWYDDRERRASPPPPNDGDNRAAEEVMYNEELKEGVPGPPSIDDWWQWDSERRVWYDDRERRASPPPPNEVDPNGAFVGPNGIRRPEVRDGKEEMDNKSRAPPPPSGDPWWFYDQKIGRWYDNREINPPVQQSRRSLLDTAAMGVENAAREAVSSLQTGANRVATGAASALRTGARIGGRAAASGARASARAATSAVATGARGLANLGVAGGRATGRFIRSSMETMIRNEGDRLRGVARTGRAAANALYNFAANQMQKLQRDRPQMRTQRNVVMPEVNIRNNEELEEIIARGRRIIDSWASEAPNTTPLERKEDKQPEYVIMNNYKDTDTDTDTDGDTIFYDAKSDQKKADIAITQEMIDSERKPALSEIESLSQLNTMARELPKPNPASIRSRIPVLKREQDYKEINRHEIKVKTEGKKRPVVITPEFMRYQSENLGFSSQSSTYRVPNAPKKERKSADRQVVENAPNVAMGSNTSPPGQTRQKRRRAQNQTIYEVKTKGGSSVV